MFSSIKTLTLINNNKNKGNSVDKGNNNDLKANSNYLPILTTHIQNNNLKPKIP